MGCKMIEAITWTQLELKGLLEDEESHVHFERVKRHLGLHPFHLTDLNAALREILSSSLNSYDSKLQGIILSYKNPKLLSRMGTVLYDTCYIHIDIEVDFYIFKPDVGDTLKGIVNKKSQDHVGILVHKAFNAVIPRPDDDENWPGHSVHIGQEIRFTVTCLDFKDRLPYIRGSLDEQDYLRGCKPLDESFAETKIVDIKPKKTKFSYEDDDFNETNADEKTVVDNNDSGVEEKVSRKKSKKLKTENSEDGVRVKTKKKHKVEDEVLVSENEVDSYERNESCVREDSNIEEKFLPGKLKLKKENNVDKIHTKKKKKKSKVKTEEILSEEESNTRETSQRNSQEMSISDEDFSPRKSKKLKKEKVEEKIDFKNKTKTKLEVEILHSDVDFDAFKANGVEKIKNEASEERSRKKHKIKTEILSSEIDSDMNQSAPNKRMKIESNGEKSSKKHKVKAEVLSSETDSGINEGKQVVKTKQESTDEKRKKKHRIKAEALAMETYD